MFGPPPPITPDKRGLAGNVADFVLRGVEARNTRPGFRCDLGISFVEVFGQDVSDLLSDKPIGVNKSQMQRMGHRFVLAGRVEHKVQNGDELEALLKAGEERKR